MPTSEAESDAGDEQDSRTLCKYGSNCYQRNPSHRTKFKHPPRERNKDEKDSERASTGKKRKSSECEDEPENSVLPPESKQRRRDEEGAEFVADDGAENPAEGPNVVVASSPSTDPKRTIRELFLVEMPDDFYKLYDFCSVLSPKDPSRALKLVDLELVGPYDALNGKIDGAAPRDGDKYLRHWRYYYDPPEFQTILKGNEKEGLHYGYWRDSTDEEPVFVAKNSANNDYKIAPVGPNVFVAISSHMEERLRRATPFEKGPISRLSKQLKSFAKANDVKLEKENAIMRGRERRVVAKTFHGAGIVVPYDKKTQVGYRDLAVTDSQLKRILKQLEEGESGGGGGNDGDGADAALEEENKKKAMASIEEVVRLATIAADESDFGTCLELGHDLFSSGVLRVQGIGLRMLAAAYKLLNREKLLKVAEAHAKDRKRDSRNLSVL